MTDLLHLDCVRLVSDHQTQQTAGKRVLHVGDFRASDDLTHGKELREVLHRGPIDILYVDLILLNFFL